MLVVSFTTFPPPCSRACFPAGMTLYEYSVTPRCNKLVLAVRVELTIPARAFLRTDVFSVVSGYSQSANSEVSLGHDWEVKGWSFTHEHKKQDAVFAAFRLPLPKSTRLPARMVGRVGFEPTCGGFNKRVVWLYAS
jgi:hypothetical protein